MIKASDIIESISMATEMSEEGKNLVNPEAVDWVIETCALEGRDVPDPIKKWLFSTVRKWIINDNYYGDSILVDPNDEDDYGADYINDPEKPWLKKAIERGEQLYFFVPLSDSGDEDCLCGDLYHVVDYLCYLFDDPDEDIPRELNVVKDLTRLSFLDALEKAKDWTNWLNKRASKEDDLDGLKEITTGGSYQWVYVTTSKALDREGKLMQHCVGSYASRVANNRCQIISLRDNQNEPHVTIEVRDKRILQIKGKQNRPPDKYRQVVAEFLNYGLDHHLFTDVNCPDLRSLGLASPNALADYR
jgi:hypothetical protein